MFIWTIENFGDLQNHTGKRIKSEPFYTHRKSCKWSLVLYPNGETNESKDYISLYLKMDGCLPDTKIDTNITLFIVNPEGQTLFSLKPYLPKTYGADFTSFYGYRQFFRRSEILNVVNGYLMGDKLRVGVELTIVKSAEQSGTSYMKFFKNEEFSDFKIVDSNGEVIPVHKLVLANKSTVFATMFDYLKKNGGEDRACINGISPPVLLAMLKFMDTEKLWIQYPLTNTEKIEQVKFVRELLEVANQYKLYSMTDICEEFLIDNVSNENAISLLQDAEKYYCYRLQRAIIDFIAVNMKDFIKTKEWVELLGKNPQLANRVELKMLEL